MCSWLCQLSRLKAAYSPSLDATELVRAAFWRLLKPMQSVLVWQLPVET